MFVAEGVKRVYAIISDSANPLNGALRMGGGLQWIHDESHAHD